MTRDSEASGDTQKIILIIGVVAVVLAVLLLVAFLPKEPEIDPHVVELEQQVLVTRHRSIRSMRLWTG